MVSTTSTAAPAAAGDAPAPILFVHHAAFDWIRGSTRCLLDLLTHMDRSRFTPLVWCNQPGILAAVRALGVQAFAAPHWQGGHPLRPSAEWVYQARTLVRACGVRLIHADEFSQVSMLVPVARRVRIPLLAQLHQVPTRDERLWTLLHQVDLAVGTTRACITGLLDDGFPPERAVVIYNGVDPVRLRSGDASGLRASLDIPGDACVATLVGSLIHRKAVDVALRAFRELLAAVPGCYLVICGSGPERAGLEELARALGVHERVRFLGECREVGAILRDASDILVAPSRDESFGLTLAEAGLFGVPAVASRIPAHEEVVGDEAGVLVPPEDVPALAGWLRRLAVDLPLRRRLGEAARRRVTAMFLIDRYVRDIEAAYARLLAAPARRYGWLRGARWPRAYYAWVREAVERRMRGRTA
jgi:glycosyltransferase involved in cell wall biosynthesis